LNIKIQYDSDNSENDVSQREPSDAALTAELGSFRKSLTALVTELGHLALGRRLSWRCPVPRRILVETVDHVVGAASMVRIFAI